MPLFRGTRLFLRRTKGAPDTRFRAPVLPYVICRAARVWGTWSECEGRPFLLGIVRR